MHRRGIGESNKDNSEFIELEKETVNNVVALPYWMRLLT